MPTSLLRLALATLFWLALVPLASGTWSIVVVNTTTREVGVGCATCIASFDLPVSTQASR